MSASDLADLRTAWVTPYVGHDSDVEKCWRARIPEENSENCFLYIDR